MDSNKTTSNLTTEALNIETLTIIQVAFYSVIAITGAAANLVLCGALLRRKHRNTSEYFILNLAITDLMTCAVGIPLDMAVILIQHWPFGAFMCKVVYPLQTALIGVSVATLTCMAIERYRAIMTPFKPVLTARVVKITVCAVWGLSVALVSPYIVILKYKHDELSCAEAWQSDNHPRVFTMCLFLLFYSLPLCVIAPAYICIGFRLHLDDKKMRRFDKKQGAGNRQFHKLVRQRTKTNIVIVKTFLFGAVAFALCLLPYHLMWLWHDFGNGSQWNHFYDGLVFANALVYFNSLVDPFIFGGTVIRRNWRKACAASPLLRCLNISVEKRRNTNRNRSLKQHLRDTVKKRSRTMSSKMDIEYTSSV